MASVARAKIKFAVIFIAIVSVFLGGYTFKAQSNENASPVKPLAQSHWTSPDANLPQSIQNNNHFRNAVMGFVDNLANVYVKQGNYQEMHDSTLDKKWFNGGHPIVNWALAISVYQEGKRIGIGHTNAKSLSKGLTQAAMEAFHQANLSVTNIHNTRFKVSFYYPPDSRQYSLIGTNTHEGKSFEWVGNVIPLRMMDTDTLKSYITLEKNYLMRMKDSDLNAMFKAYSASSDKKSIRLRTIYTSSSLFTLLKINEVMPDPAIQAMINPMADFILSMQVKKGPNKGAFYYSYNKIKHTKQKRFVVGTASKTIFTLLILFEKTHDEKYLTAAREAGNWLLTKVSGDGHVNPVLFKHHSKLNGLPNNKAQKWEQITKKSFLYSGQVLSALSRLYSATGDKAYNASAERIANSFVSYVKTHGPFVGDDFRTPNSVSTSWLVMSLIDYAKVNNAPIYRSIITKCARELLVRQASDTYDAFNHGRVVDLISASGNGWVNEVMTVLYPFCRSHHMMGCEGYRQFVIHSSRWLMQNVYTADSALLVKNPANASGGAIPNFLGDNVRTDAVCHGGNSLVGLLGMVNNDNQMLSMLPENSLDEVLGLLGIGRFPETF